MTPQTVSIDGGDSQETGLTTTSGEWFLAGISQTPDVAFPDTAGAGGAARSGVAGGITLSAYSFLTIGSVGDLSGSNLKGPGGSLTVHQQNALRKARAHAAEVLSALTAIKDYLLSLKSTLEVIDPALDRNAELVALLRRFEGGFKRAKKTFLEPDNLV